MADSARWPHIDWPWSQVRRYQQGRTCLDRCGSGHTYGRWCLLRGSEDPYRGPWPREAVEALKRAVGAEKPVQWTYPDPKPMRDPEGRVVDFEGWHGDMPPPGWEWAGSPVTGGYQRKRDYAIGGLIASARLTQAEEEALARRFRENDGRPGGILILDDPPRRHSRWRWRLRTQCGQEQPASRGLRPYRCSRRRWHWGGHEAVLRGEELARWARA